MSASDPVGIFDSGIGGLSVVDGIVRLLPKERFVYFGDTARIPYGSKSPDTIREYAAQITRFLLDQGCKAIVVACNTASAAALPYLREQWPDVTIVGMEPAVKPSAQATKTGKVGVLATRGTLQSERNVLNTQNLALPQLTASGLHTVGPFAAGDAVIVTLENATNAICNTTSPQVINLPCALVDCGPTEYTIFYGDNDWVQQAYQGSGSQEIGIRFLGGTLGFGDNAHLYNAADPEDATPVALTGGNLVNGLFTSGTPSTDRTLILEITADNAHSWCRCRSSLRYI